MTRKPSDDPTTSEEISPGRLDEAAAHCPTCTCGRRAPEDVEAVVKQDDWLCGYAAALAAVHRLYDRSAIVLGVMGADGLSLEDFRRAGVEDFDLRELERASNEEI